MKTYFQIEEPNEKTPHAILCEGSTREDVLKQAHDYYQECQADDDVWGEGGYVILIHEIDDDGEIVSTEEMELTVVTEKDFYDGGRFDYYSSRI